MADLFHNILVPVDFTEKNKAALRFAVNLAKQNHARVTLLHVIETIDYATDEDIEEFYDMLKSRSRVNLSDCGEQFSKAKVPVSTEVVMGKPARGIVDYVIQNKIDLVILSSHQVELTPTPKGWATLSYQVSILCPCPVMLVK